MRLMQSISGLTLYLVTQEACQNTNLRMNFRPRRSVSSKDSRRKLQNGRNYSIHSHTLGCHPSSKLVNYTPGPRYGLVQTSPRHRWLLGQATITGSLGDPPEVRTGILKVATQVVGITLIEEGKAEEEEEEDIIALHIPHKYADHHLMPGAVCLHLLALLAVGLPVAMESARLIFHKVVVAHLMVVLQPEVELVLT